MLAYYFPPVKVVGAHRLYHFYLETTRVADSIHVITADNHTLFRHDPSLALPQVRLVYASTHGDLRTRWARRQGGASSIAATTAQSPIKAWLRRLRQSFPAVLWWGDGGLAYILAAYRQGAKVINEQGITHIFSSYRPWSDHVAAWLLKRRYPQLVWIADFRDLPVDERRRDVLWPRLQNRFAARLLRSAQRITTVSEGLAGTFSSILKRPVEVLQNGLPQAAGGAPSVALDANFTIAYTGSLYPGLQSADMLLGLLRKLLTAGELNPARLRLVYAGRDGALWDAWLLQHGLRHLGQTLPELDLAEARALQRQSQLNVLLSWSDGGRGGVLTAKVYDYLAAGRPILALVNGPEDAELLRLVEHTGGGRVFSAHTPGAEAAMTRWLLDGYRAWAWSGAWPWQASAEALRPYTWSAQVAAFWEKV